MAVKLGASSFSKEREKITIRTSAAEYLTYVASAGDRQDSVEMQLSRISG